MAKSGPFTRKIPPFGALGGLLLLVTGYMAFLPDDGLRQPLQYNHKVHIETAGLTCTDCHESVEVSARATFPRLETCSLCHSGEPISESPEEQKLLEFVSEGREIPWKRVYRVPDHVYFSHRRHITGGGLECAACHGEIPEFTEPVSVPFAPVTMKQCMDCHRQNGVTNDCLACHR